MPSNIRSVILFAEQKTFIDWWLAQLLGMQTMKLYECEGKRLLANAGFSVPKGLVVRSVEEVSGLPDEACPAMVKAQVLAGRRGKAGAVLACQSKEQIEEAVSDLLSREVLGSNVDQILVEDRLAIVRETYLSVSYQQRIPVVIACSRGGVDVEEVRNTHPELVVAQPISITKGLDATEAEGILTRAGFGDDAVAVADILVRLFTFFLDNDALIVEINPLVKTETGEWYLADAKIELDDDASYRLEHLKIPSRPGSGKPPTKLEQMAHDNDLIDNRGAAGRMFYEIEDGNIVVLAAGGGTSSEALDALFLVGGHPAVFTEHSGNPTGEKVKGITRIALMYPGPIDAIWIVGGRANFTDIYETVVNGIMAGIREKEGFDKTTPIVVRRGGPRDEETFEVLHEFREKEGYNIFLRGMATSVFESARMVVHLADKHDMERKKAVR